MIRRHQLVWLNRSPVAIDPLAQTACDDWLEAGLPFITTRQASENELRLGFCTPRQTDGAPPQRIGVVANMDTVKRISSPPLLSEAVMYFDGLKPICGFAETRRFHLYGSYLWEFLTNRVYTTTASDLDAFTMVVEAEEIPEAIACFKKLESRLPMRVDGEVSIEGWGEINWRELAASTESLLLKTSTGATLINRDQIPCRGKRQSA